MFEKLSILTILLVLGIILKKESIIIPVVVIIIIVLLNLNNKNLESISTFSIKYGIILITVYAFLPIAKGQVTFHQLFQAFVSWRAWIAIGAGILVTYFARNGLDFMHNEPDLLTFILVGIIIGIIAFKGYATGPLIGSGIAVLLYGIVDFFIMLFD